MSVDPMFKEYVPFSPYIFGLNNPIFLVDKDGNVVVDANGNPVTISITKSENGTATATYEFVKGTTDEVKAQFMANGAAIINDMLITTVGQEQVAHLVKTVTKVTLQISDDIGIAKFEGKYYVMYGVSGPPKDKSDKMVEDYDGGQVYEEATITVFKGSLKYGQGDKSELEQGKITMKDLVTGKVTKPNKFKGKIEPFQHPDKLYNSQFQLNNLGGSHETEHLKSSNIKTKNNGGDYEEEPMKKEDDSRKDINFKK